MGVALKWNFDGDNSEVLLKIGSEPGQGTDLTVNAAQLVKLIEALGRLRGQMIPEVSADFNNRNPNGADGDLALHDPGYRISGEKLDGKRLLAIRNPNYGWQALLFPQHEADKIAEWLVKDALDPLATPKGSA